MKILLIFLLTVFLFSCNSVPSADTVEHTSKKAKTPQINWTYINSYLHDTTSFTEGLLICYGELYESTGSPKDFAQARSLLGTVDLTKGEIDVKVELDRKLFGEGIAVLDEKIFWLTYKAKKGFVYELKTFKKIREFVLPTKEGWGLTTDGVNLIMSNGTHRLTFLDPETFKVVKIIMVTENKYVIENLNELEYINGFIYANVWPTNMIVKIDPESGKVVGKLDFTPLAEEAKHFHENSREMNGIAYDSISDRVFLTGKFWPRIFEIKLEDN